MLGPSPSEYLSEAWGIHSLWPEHTWPQADPSICLSLPYTNDHFMQALTHDFEKVENTLNQWPFSWVRWDKIWRPEDCDLPMSFHNTAPIHVVWLSLLYQAWKGHFSSLGAG